MEEAFFDTPLYREFVGLSDNVRLPDESTILRFGKTPSPRHRLEKNGLADKILAELNAILTERGLLLKEGSAVDADSGLVHTVRCTSGNEHDFTQAHRLLHGNENAIWAVCIAGLALSVPSSLAAWRFSLGKHGVMPW